MVAVTIGAVIGTVLTIGVVMALPKDFRWLVFTSAAVYSLVSWWVTGDQDMLIFGGILLVLARLEVMD